MKHPPVQGRVDFLWMALKMRIRYWRSPPAEVLRELGLRPGMNVLDFGCGPGHFACAAARCVAPAGLVYAIDRYPFAVRWVERKARRLGLENVIALPGEGADRVPDGSVDVALCYNVLHEVPSLPPALEGIHRALKPGGALSARDRHMEESELRAAVESTGRFRWAGRGPKAFRFERRDAQVPSP